ncbi:unnamed protein product [Mytilus coruscus]|uniref:Uncharacterized protein n=1 Tax=Mytilus coruscus TaxID=42192 RepID=A0A6J8EZV7_MYTCO|nr:unnamed protein product [Mytilus coruscus]
MEETAVEEAILKLCELLRETADLTSSSNAIFNAKPKLKVWTPEIQEKGNDAIMELEVNCKKYVENDNIINGFQEHFSSLATFNEITRIDSQYHNLVQDDIQSINKLVQQNNIKNVTSEKIKKAIRSINKGKSADYHGITIEHIIYAGSDTEKLLVPLRKQEFNNQTFKMGPNDMPSIEKATHLGIIRTTSLKGNMIANVDENIKKQDEVLIAYSGRIP